MADAQVPAQGLGGAIATEKRSFTYPAGWLKGYTPALLSTDLVAGLTAAAVVVPNAMAYAVIAGLNVEAGLYCALAAMLMYPLLGSSRPLSVSTTSAIAMLTGGAIAQAAANGSQAPPAAVAAALALAVGGIMLAARVLRLGFLANFISVPVLVGFKAGVGLVIIIGQLKSVLGLHVASRTTLGILGELPGLLRHSHGPTLMVALAGIGLLLVLNRRWPHFPAPLAVVVLSIAAAAAFGLAGLGVKPAGAVPSGLPALALPDPALASALWPSALGIALMAFAESVAAARAFIRREDPPVNANRELAALGVANLAAALVGGMPAGGGTSQTAVADRAGARSQMAQWVGAASVLAVLLCLSGVISLLPQATLGALIMVTAASMIGVDQFRAIARIRKDELAWALVTLAGVVLVGTLDGILIGVVISMLTLIYQANHPAVYALGYNRERRIFRPAGLHAGDETIPGLLMLRSEGMLTFANAANTAEKMRALVDQYRPRCIILECSGIPDMEYSALTMFTEAEQDFRAQGGEVWLAAINPRLLAVIERSPLGRELGHARMFIDLHLALETYLARNPDPVVTLKVN